MLQSCAPVCSPLSSTVHTLTRINPVMATFWNLVLVVSLLALSAPQRCSGVDLGSLKPQDVKILSAMQIFNNALKCTSETIKESLRLHEKNSEALKDLHSLPEMVLTMREQMSVQSENIDSMKKQLTALQSGDVFSQENAELKNQLETKDKMVDALSQEIAQLKYQLENKDEMVNAVTEEIEDVKQQLRNKDEMVQVLEMKIMDYQRKEEQLEDTLVQLNNTVAAQKKCAGSAPESMSPQQKIKMLVQQYSFTKDWDVLRRCLESVLDRSSEPYSQLQRVDGSTGSPLWYVGYHGSTQLVSLLLDAGLPADAGDASGETMLHGAAGGGHVRLVKLLLDRGACVDARNVASVTPLVYAASRDHLPVVQLLVAAGADTSAKDTTSNSALYYARENRNTAVAQYLQQLPH